MAYKGMRGLNEALRVLSLSSSTCKEAASHRLLQPVFSRSMATQVSKSHLTTSVESSAASRIYTPTSHVPVTIHSFPYLEPQRLENWSAKHLHLPLRRDLLHLAVVYEGDKTRQGTASSKTRYEVHGSHRKLYRQKGTGRARVGSKQSPLRRGGGKTFGPHPRDFSTKLNRKVYDLAWRTALSYRYRRGELLVCQDGMELPLPEEFLDITETGHVGRELEEGFRRKFVKQIMEANEWGRLTGRTTFITGDRREELFKTMELAPEHGRALDVEDVDVKDLLETGRLVVERQALKEMIENHQSDLITRVFVNGLPSAGPVSGEIAVE